MPEKSGAEWGIVALLFVLATGYRLLFRRFVPMSYDEGITLQGAQRILDGQVLYRDFFSLVTPGSYYFFALIFRIFGDSMVVARTVVAIYGGFFSVTTYLIARRVCQRWSAFLSAYIVAVLVLPVGWVLHNWDSTLWSCLALYCAVWLLQRPHWSWALAMASCASTTVLFEQSKGAGLLLGLAVGFVILWVSGELHLKRTEIIAASVGFFWPVVITVGYFAARHSLSPMVSDLLWPFQHYSGLNSVPFGLIEGGQVVASGVLEGSWLYAVFVLLTYSPYFLVPALPVFALGILAFSTLQLQSSGGRVRSRPYPYYVLVCACSMGLLLSVVATRRDAIHFMFLAPIFCLILAWFLDGKDIRLRILDSVRPALIFLLTLVFTINGIAMLASNGNARRYVETRRGRLRVPAGEAALSYLQKHTVPGEQIFVYPWCPLYYYLTAASNPTRYEFMLPGYHTAEQFQEALRSIAARRPRVVLFQPAFYEEMTLVLPSTPIAVLAAPDSLTDYILAKYRVCATLTSANSGRLLFMTRKDLPCPAQ